MSQLITSLSIWIGKPGKKLPTAQMLGARFQILSVPERLLSLLGSILRWEL